MRSADLLFSTEFKKMMDDRRAIAKPFSIAKLPIPPHPSLTAVKPRGKKALIKGITEMFFDRLNNTEVEFLVKTSLKKRKVLSDGSFKRNEKGDIETIDIAVPRGSVAVISDISIGLTRTVDGKVHKVSEGFRYVDFISNAKGRKYIYIVPRQYVYRLNMGALILTMNKRRNYYKGVKLALQNGSYIYAYAIPYQYREMMDVRILSLKSSCMFDEELNVLMQGWSRVGIIYHTELTKLENNAHGVTNLGVQWLDGTLPYEEYKRYGVSLDKEKEEDLVDWSE